MRLKTSFLKNNFSKRSIKPVELFRISMFLSTRDEFKNYLKETKKHLWQIFIKNKELNILIESDGKPTGVNGVLTRITEKTS